MYTFMKVSCGFSRVYHCCSRNVLFAIEFDLEFAGFAIEDFVYVLELIAFVHKFIRNKNGSCSNHKNKM